MYIFKNKLKCKYKSLKVKYKDLLAGYGKIIGKIKTF